MVTSKKQAIFGEKLSETAGKAKELLESPKSLGMQNKTVISTFNAIEDSNTLTRDTQSILKIFKKLVSNLAEYVISTTLNQ